VDGRVGDDVDVVTLLEGSQISRQVRHTLSSE
jgi:hypothetical protein